MNVKSAILLGIILILGGCAVPVPIPSDAQLIWYGRFDSIDQMQNTFPKADGRIYVVNGVSGRVILVRTIREDVMTPFSLPFDEVYRIYFVKREVAPPMQPTTRKAQ